LFVSSLAATGGTIVSGMTSKDGGSSTSSDLAGGEALTSTSASGSVAGTGAESSLLTFDLVANGLKLGSSRCWRKSLPTFDFVSNGLKFGSSSWTSMFIFFYFAIFHSGKRKLQFI